MKHNLASPRRLLTIALAFFSLSSLVDELQAATISWVDVSTWTPGSLSRTGLTSDEGLIVDVTFSNVTNLRSRFPMAGAINIADSAWPFTNTAVPLVLVVSSGNSGGASFTGQVIFDFTSLGGIASGGGVGIIDLEDPASFVQLTGFQGGNPVDVNWKYIPYQIAGESAPPLDWNPGTSTLTGTTPIKKASSALNNFSFLASDKPLDSIVMTVHAASEDGIGFAVSGSNVPEPSRALLSVLGLGALLMRRRRCRTHTLGHHPAVPRPHG